MSQYREHRIGGRGAPSRCITPKVLHAPCGRCPQDGPRGIRSTLLRQKRHGVRDGHTCRPQTRPKVQSTTRYKRPHLRSLRFCFRDERNDQKSKRDGIFQHGPFGQPTRTKTQIRPLLVRRNYVGVFRFLPIKNFLFLKNRQPEIYFVFNSINLS